MHLLIIQMCLERVNTLYTIKERLSLSDATSLWKHLCNRRIQIQQRIDVCDPGEEDDFDPGEDFDPDSIESHRFH